MATLGSKSVGSIVTLKESGAAVNYIVVHQGLPSSIYDSSCDGTWLLREAIAVKRVWHSSEKNDYENSDIKTYLNGTYLAKFSSDIKAVIKEVKIPYVPGGGSASASTGADGLSNKVFLLAAYEVGFTNSTDGFIRLDGAKLDYFESGTTTDAKAKRIAYYNGSSCDWYHRTPYPNMYMTIPFRYAARYKRDMKPRCRNVAIKNLC